MRSTFRILFYLKRNVPKKDGTVPVYCRITLNGTISQFSCKLFINPRLWDIKTQTALGEDCVSRHINTELQKIRKGIKKHYEKVLNGIGPLTAERVRISYCGLDRSNRTLLQVFENHNKEFEQLTKSGIRQLRSYYKYISVYNHLKEFLRLRYRKQDISLADVQTKFITDFEMYLRNRKSCSNNTVWTYITPLRKIIRIAQDNGWIECNPFCGHRIVHRRTERIYLTMDEINALMNVQFIKHTVSYERIRDLFIFCVFTGISFVDLNKLTRKNIKHTDNETWICFNRHKTGIACNIPLLKIPLAILAKYENKNKKGNLFPVPTYSTLLHGIKRVAKLCNIDKHLSWHVARHTFATEICLQNGVPIETISRMLGHTDVKTTQIYAKISNTVISREMGKLAKALESE